MFHAFFRPRYRRCSDCGGPVPETAFADHLCDPEEWLDHQMAVLAEDIADLPGEIHAYLASPEGRFDLWRAERARLAREDRPG